jgi:hypothetical protein
MNINELSRHDCVRCIVTGSNEKGCFLKIINLNDNIVGRIFDTYLEKGTVVFATVGKIFEGYTILKLDSVDYYSDNTDFAA